MTAGGLKNIKVLAIGPLHNRARTRLEGAMDVLAIPSADLSAVPAEMRGQVRAAAVQAPVNAAFIDAFPNLEIIANFGVGYDAVDAAHAGKVNVMVTNTPDVLTDEVADTAIGLLLNTLREFPKAEAWLRDGKWVSTGAYPLTRLTLRDRTVGIFGMGRIGQAIAHRLQAFGVSIHYHNRRKVDGVAHTYHPTLLELAKAVDTLVCVAPGGASTEHAVNADVLAALGPDGVLVNIGRGSVVDENALIPALASGTIAAAGLDVFEKEPHVPQALIDLPNACLLPHVGSASVHTRNGMADLVADNVMSWFGEGKAITAVAETAHVKPGMRKVSGA